MTINTPPLSTQQGTQTTEKEEIWSGILKGVASSKMVPSKKVLILGDPASGKSTLIHYLKNDPGPQIVQNDNDEAPTASNVPFNISRRADYMPVDNQTDDATNTLALGYSFIDVQDEDNEEGSAGETWSKGKAIIDELREKVEHYMQTYTEPASASGPFNLTTSTSTGSVPSTPTTFTTPLVTTTTSADQVTLPLTQGTLTNNLGLPLIVVCCKSDAQLSLEQSLDYKDEQFDFIQQTLRCICMKFGAALFYTSTLQPYTFHNLRQYILHRLLATSTKTYPFQLKAQVVERDSVMVPAGWDSWGKLRVLREGFDCEAVHQGWDSDMDAIADRQQPGFHGARGSYEEVIADPNSKEQPMSNVPPPVTCEDEQTFLERHFETLQHGSELPGRKGTGAQSMTRPSVVGPLGVSSSAVDLMRTGITSTAGEDRRLKDSPLDSVKIASSTATSAPTIKTPASTTASAGLTSTTSTLPSIDSNLNSPITGVNQPGGPSHEVLANFFQSLLVKKASSTSVGTPSSPTTTLLGNPALGSKDVTTEDGTSSSPSSAGSSRRPTISRKDVHKELDRMRQYVNKQ
ncbi:dynein light intermediate chain-domain-containing protein [Choanephora cucurbitarum]|nr:dynein light intermediate chain-domain-containing protein [Choanephora cucurbitarum]